jgi:protein-disulfide isomerase
MKSSLLAAALACISFAALADEAEVRKAVESKLGKVEKIVKAPMAGIWEVTVDSQIFYSDDKGSYLIFGNLLDMKTGKNLTTERQFNSLPLELAIKQVRGSGKNVMVTFEDPNCGYCKKLAKDVLTLKDVTVYTFLLPVLGDDSYEKSKAIWCAPDKRQGLGGLDDRRQGAARRTGQVRHRRSQQVGATGRQAAHQRHAGDLFRQRRARRRLHSRHRDRKALRRRRLTIRRGRGETR